MAPAASPSNPYKRQIDAVQHVYECAKRAKISSNPAPSTVPNEPALAPTDGPGGAAEESEAESEAGSDDGSDDESWPSESSEEPSDEGSEGSAGSAEAEDEDEHGRDADEAGVQRDVGGVVNLRANMGKRPAFTLPGEEGLEDMRPFLKDFLPRLKAANEELEAQKAAGQLQTSEIMGDEEAAGEEPYIELNLGLGVLEERDDDADEGPPELLEHAREGGDTEQHHQEKDILGKLMGREKRTEPVGIQEVVDTQGGV